MLRYLFRVIIGWPYAIVGCFLSLFRRYGKMDDPIDFVVLWVDDKDVEWRKQKELWRNRLCPDTAATAKERSRDWDIFNYWFRAVEKFAPWVRYVHLVTDVEVPTWLDLSNPKLRLVRHEDIMPVEVLPSFNSAAIESCLHNIPGLSEHFVYFNDDMFLTRPANKEDFFRVGKPVLCASGSPVRINQGTEMFNHQQFSTVGSVGCFNWVSWMWHHPARWFSFRNGIGLIHNIHDFMTGNMSGVFYPHLAAPMRKSTYILAWATVGDTLSRTVSHRFRQYNDIYQHLFTLIDMNRGDFVPCSRKYFGRFFLLGSQSHCVDDFCHSLSRHRYLCSCLNDSHLVTSDNYQTLKQQIIEALQGEFPEKSSFEL